MNKVELQLLKINNSIEKLELQLRMIDEAIAEYGEIFPCYNVKFLKDSFTMSDHNMYFWFNDKDNSTHVVKKSVSIEFAQQ